MDSHRLIMCGQTQSSTAEAYRILRTNLSLLNTNEDIKTIMFTSAVPGEGKSTTVANVAAAFAQSGKQVVIIDCDLRNAIQHNIFSVKKEGVSEILSGKRPTTALIQKTSIANLSILASGPLPNNPSELLSSDKLVELLASLRVQYDYIFIDAPPAVGVSDVGVLASKADGVVLVLASGNTLQDLAKKAKDILIKAHGRILGVVLNKVEFENEHKYYQYCNCGDKKA